MSIYWCFLLRRKNRAYGVVLLNALAKLSRMMSTCLPFERSLALSWIITVSCVSYALFFRELCWLSYGILCCWNWFIVLRQTKKFTISFNGWLTPRDFTATLWIICYDLIVHPFFRQPFLKLCHIQIFYLYRLDNASWTIHISSLKKSRLHWWHLWTSLWPF